MSQSLEVPRTHIHFTFDTDDCWPPVPGEALWATELGDDRYLIDNIPFFVEEIALNDVVEARAGEDGCLHFTRKLASGGHSTIQVGAHETVEEELIGALKTLGCGLERDEPGFFSVDVPPEVSLLDALALCDRWSSTGFDSIVTAKAICLQREA
jgi:hypothetical protein